MGSKITKNDLHYESKLVHDREKGAKHSKKNGPHGLWMPTNGSRRAHLQSPF